MRTKETIVAISTPHGVGGIAVARLSGPDALSIAEKHLSPLTSHLSPRHATYCTFFISSPETRRGEGYDNTIPLDDVVAVFFPKGYTGEPTVEISCHGSLYVQQALLQALVDDGARLAEPGEFTQRAFLNGRLDLSQAEAVADLIDSVTPAQHRLAVSQLRGGYAQNLKDLRQQLLDLTSLLELELDFSQEDVEFADRTQLRNLLSSLITQLSTLIASFKMGNALKRGVPVAIIGAPNAGKSSLLNALLGDDRAIVSDVPGTTRDTIEELFVLDGVTFRFIDTAGLRHSDDIVEAMGIERSRKAVADAHLVIFVHDVTTPWHEPALDLSDKKVLVVLNKSDLTPHSSLNPPLRQDRQRPRRPPHRYGGGRKVRHAARRQHTSYQCPPLRGDVPSEGGFVTCQRGSRRRHAVRPRGCRPARRPLPPRHHHRRGLLRRGPGQHILPILHREMKNDVNK